MALGHDKSGVGMKTRPFWEDTYADPEQDTFGEPSSEVIDLASRLAPGARVLDAGCGDGRHALYLARRGFAVDAFDSSDRAITKLKKRAEAEGLCVSAWVEDLRQILDLFLLRNRLWRSF